MLAGKFGLKTSEEQRRSWVVSGGERGKERRRKPEETATSPGGLGGCEAGLPPSHTRDSRLVIPGYSARCSIAHSEQASSSSSADEREPTADRIAAAPRRRVSFVPNRSLDRGVHLRK